MAEVPISIRAQRLLRLAHEEADQVQPLRVSSVHLLLGALSCGGYIKRALCSRSSFSINELRSRISEMGSTSEDAKGGYTQSSRNILRAAARISRTLGHKDIDAEHIVLALLAERRGRAARALKRFAFNKKNAKTQIQRRIRIRRGRLPPSAHL